MNIKKMVCALLLFTTCFCFAGCGLNKNVEEVSGEEKNLNIAYQYGLSYAPLIICKEKGLIETEYFNRTGEKLTINWAQMSSGADINSAFASGDLDVACLGIAPAITGISNNIGYKIFSGISGQEHGLMTNDESIASLGDYIGSDKQIALVNTGSIQHIILAKALTENGFDAHALDSNIVAMKHPDGMVSLESGSISGHLTSNPYIYKERDNSELHELEEIKDAWGTDYSFIVGIASSKVSNNTELYDVICDSFKEAIELINSNPEEVAQITCELDGNSYEDELVYIKAGVYSEKTSNIMGLANFMYENKFINNKISEYGDLTYSNVEGD